MGVFGVGNDSEEGLGLNVFFKSWYNLVHVPLIFAGFSILYVPYILLLGGRVQHTEILLLLIKKYNNIGICFLFAGVFFGSMWAYNSLGWGGY